MIILLSMRRLLVLSCLVVASAEPTDKAKAKIDAQLSATRYAAPRRRAQGPSRRKKRKTAPQATALPSGAWNASTLAEPWRDCRPRGRATGRRAAYPKEGALLHRAASARIVSREFARSHQQAGAPVLPAGSVDVPRGVHPEPVCPIRSRSRDEGIPESFAGHPDPRTVA